MTDGLGWTEHDERFGVSPGNLRTDVPHPARMYDYYLGGKDNFPADREAAEQVIQAYPLARLGARANRAWLGRAVRYAAGEGIRQFLDIGTGIPSRGNTNEVAHEVAPDARILYVDNDPIVLSHARALLAHGDETRRTSVMLGDLREPDAIMAEAGTILDLDEPVALMLVAVLHFVRDADEPHAIVRDLLGRLAPGSMLMLSHGTGEFATADAVVRGKGAYDQATAPLVVRDRAGILAFFAGTRLVAPGLVQQPWWRPDGPVPPRSEQISIYAGVGVTA